MLIVLLMLIKLKLIKFKNNNCYLKLIIVTNKESFFYLNFINNK